MFYKINDDNYINLNFVFRIDFPSEEEIEKKIKEFFNLAFQYEEDRIRTVVLDNLNYQIEKSKKGYESLKSILSGSKSFLIGVKFYNVYSDSPFCYNLTINEINKLKEFISKDKENE